MHNQAEAAAPLLNQPKLTRAFYAQDDCAQVAQQLLNKILVVNHQGTLQAGRIVETEAYLGPKDLAAHSARGRTPRTQVMFGPPGHAYVYLIYGIHHCMNVVTEADGHGAAVLLRALEPVQNLDDNTRGPGRLCKAMGIDLAFYGHDLCGNSLYIAHSDNPVPISIAARPRVGVDYAGEWADKPLRFYIKDNRYISKK